MKQTLVLLVFLSLNTFLCFGMKKGSQGLIAESQDFYTSTRNLNREAQQADQAMDQVFDFLHLGWFNRFIFGTNQVAADSVVPADDEQDNQSSARASMRARNSQNSSSSTGRRSYQTEEERLECLNRKIEKAEDLNASSKQFALQAKENNHTHSSLIFQMLISENARTIYGFISSGLIFYVGIKNIKNSQENKIFGYSATLLGAVGAASMLYNLIKK